MDLYPAIDLRGGRVVQLQQGDYSRESHYGDDPLAIAERFAAAGARWIHVVDLDAARSGDAGNREVIAKLCAHVACRIETGGGVRDIATVESRLESGVERVVIGTAAVERPELVDEAADRFPGRVAVGLDARGRDVSTHGWTSSSGLDLLDLARRFDRRGVGALVVTEISRDGMLGGPDLAQLTTVLGAVSVPVIASGGVASLGDLRALAALEVEGRRLAGAITGTALYEGRFGIEEAIGACSQSA
jgi:phosphoribosylformimino-5-aminoimidazole carboxamide ribotide isomerase